MHNEDKNEDKNKIRPEDFADAIEAWWGEHQTDNFTLYSPSAGHDPDKIEEKAAATGSIPMLVNRWVARRGVCGCLMLTVLRDQYQVDLEECTKDNVVSFVHETFYDLWNVNPENLTFPFDGLDAREYSSDKDKEIMAIAIFKVASNFRNFEAFESFDDDDDDDEDEWSGEDEDDEL